VEVSMSESCTRGDSHSFAAAARLASIALLGIPATLLSPPTAVAQKLSGQSPPTLIVTSSSSIALLRTSGWPILTVGYGISTKRIDRHHQLPHQDTILAHRQFDRGGY
jgi:hypothetical protein